MLAFALRADGWYLRSDIIWAKPNPMPESVTDRPTKAHEYLFLLSKSARYYYDADAIREEHAPESVARYGRGNFNEFSGGSKETGAMTREAQRRTVVPIANGRNKRTVWTIATEPYPEAHFATFPTALVTPCVLAGCPEGGTVLEPFAGSGTTLAVAKQLGRKSIGIELNADYCQLAAKRLRAISEPMFVGEMATWTAAHG
jgi:DNA modification methylase